MQGHTWEVKLPSNTGNVGSNGHNIVGQRRRTSACLSPSATAAQTRRRRPLGRLKTCFGGPAPPLQSRRHVPPAPSIPHNCIQFEHRCKHVTAFVWKNTPEEMKLPHKTEDVDANGDIVCANAGTPRSGTGPAAPRCRPGQCRSSLPTARTGTECCQPAETT